MQTETSEKSLVKLSQLADDINGAFKESNAIAVEAIRGSQAAIRAAVRAGGLLAKAKSIIEHGKWEKWLSDSCPDIGPVTAQRWMALAKTSQVKDLKEAKNLTDAYRKIGLIPERADKAKPMGTAPVDMFAELYRKFDKGLGPVIDIAAGVEVCDMPPEMRTKLLSRAQPVVEMVEKLKALEAA